MNHADKRHRKVRKWKEGPNFSGQHLLHGRHIIQEIVALADIEAHETVVEIGAGKGALTFPLSRRAGTVLAIENDPGFALKLRQRAESYSNIKIVEKDVMEFRMPRTPYSVVANIPFAITTPILRKLLDRPSGGLRQAVLILELGAANRFTEIPTTNPRILAWRMWFDLERVCIVPRSRFSPPPRVDAAIVRIRRKSQPLVPHRYDRPFMELAAYALQNPGLALCEALRGVFTARQMTRLVNRIGADRHTPVCGLTERQWSEVFLAMAEHVEPCRWPRGGRKS